MDPNSELSPVSIDYVGKNVEFDSDVARYAIEFIRVRPPEGVHENFERNNKALTEYVLEENPNLTAVEFEAKAQVFEQFYKEKLYPHVVHGLTEDIQTPEIQLKSSRKLAQEQGKLEEEVSKQQAGQDRTIGNTNMVFANLLALYSRSFKSNVYQIESKEVG